MTDQPTPAITPKQLAELAGLYEQTRSFSAQLVRNAKTRLTDSFPALQATIDGLWRENDAFRAFNPVVPHERNDSCCDWWYCLACHVEAIHDGDDPPSVDVFPHTPSCPWRINSNTKVGASEGLQAIVERQAKEIEALRGDIACMVNKAADNCLDGYRELGMKAANAENALDTERAAHAETRQELAIVTNDRESWKAQARQHNSDLAKARDRADRAEADNATLRAELDSLRQRNALQWEMLERQAAVLRAHRLEHEANVPPAESGR